MSTRGVSVQNNATGVLPPVESLAGLPVYVGSGAIHMSADKTPKLNKPILVRSYAEAVAAVGFIDAAGSTGSKKFDFTLCEAISAHFKINNIGPIVLVNVLDPTTHKTAHAAESRVVGGDNKATLAVKHVWPASVVVKDSTDTTTHVLGTDYTFALSSDGSGVITRLTAGAIAAGATLHVSYDTLDPSAVDSADVIGTVNAGTQAKTGFELIEEVFPRYRLVPGQVLAPGFMDNATVVAAAQAKAADINGHFRAPVLADIPTGTVDVYTDAAAWKASNFSGVDLIACWPLGRLGDVLYHLSTLTAVRAMQTDAVNGGTPHESPSNKAIKIDSLALIDGSEVILDPKAAAALNAQGIVTAQNFVGGWVLWGSRTTVYPASTDVADTFIPFVRMRAWNTSVLVLSHWQRVDNPLNRRKIESVVDSENIRLNSLTADGVLIGARVEFLEADNPTTDLMDGKVVYSVRYMPPPPMESITFKVEIDPSYLSKLFA